MKRFLHFEVLSSLTILCCAGLLTSFCYAQETLDLLNPPVVKQYEMNCTYLSIDPNRPMETYKRHGSGMLGAGATLGGSWRDEVRSFRTTIHSGIKEGRFWISVEVEPHQTDTVTKQQTLHLDLSDLRARSVELARNVDGRVYFINVVPSINVINNKAKRLRESTLRLMQWDLGGSPVVFNSTTYIGNLGCSGGPIAWVEYPSVGRVEFSLVPFKGAEAAGILMDGQVNLLLKGAEVEGTQKGRQIKLLHKDATLDIYGVRNGIPAMQLPGGPYMVWVKRTPSTDDQPPMEIPATLEEFMQQVKAQFAEMGQTPPDDDQLRAGYEKLKDMKLLPLSNGVRGISRKERIE
ncbi:hypothetical protein ACFL6U_11850 [Planctomycetota bacterium]